MIIQFTKDKIKDFSCVSLVLNFSFEALRTMTDYNQDAVRLKWMAFLVVMVRL